MKKMKIYIYCIFYNKIYFTVATSSVAQECNVVDKDDYNRRNCYFQRT